jgi:hypothetical protein
MGILYTITPFLHTKEHKGYEILLRENYTMYVGIFKSYFNFSKTLANFGKVLVKIKYAFNVPTEIESIFQGKNIVSAAFGMCCPVEKNVGTAAYLR